MTEQKAQAKKQALCVNLREVNPLRHLYLHIPFCAKICPYCAFYVHQGSAAFQREFISGLRREWARAREEFPLALETIYFGGGTPSLLQAELFYEMATDLAPAGEIEFTLEVNPATVTPEKAAAWKKAGVNRISLGAQSFDPELLKLLGRTHTPEEIAETCQLLREHGFSNLNLDLMFALPSQAESTWEETLQTALACQPQHLSAYALTYEEDTPFFQQLKSGAWHQNEAREIAMFEHTQEVLAQAGFARYEISNYARTDYESRHNLGYWRGTDYLGLGPSAVSTVGDRRWKNLPETRGYLEKIGRGESVRTELETLDPLTRRKERIMFGLRLAEGVAREEFQGRENQLSDLMSEGLITAQADRIGLTPRGQLVADSVAGLFV